MDFNHLIHIDWFASSVALVVGFLLDLLLGDPAWLPHPVRLFGWLISLFESRMNNNNRRRLKGVFMVIVLCILVIGSLIFIDSLLIKYKYSYIIYTSIMIFYGLANKSLIIEVLKVERKLQAVGINSARIQLSCIVGRDTAHLNKKEIRKALIETLSENLSDGVIAPLFYYSIGGIPLMFTYKLVNTMDSMVGYKNEKYILFGWFAARLDDLLNLIPARITAFLMVLVSISWRGMKFIFKYGSHHSSPNAGYPEAAISGILNCQLGGPNKYEGEIVNKPYIGNLDRDLGTIDIHRACLINFLSTTVFILLIVVAKLLWIA